MRISSLLILKKSKHWLIYKLGPPSRNDYISVWVFFSLTSRLTNIQRNGFLLQISLRPLLSKSVAKAKGWGYNLNNDSEIIQTLKFSPNKPGSLILFQQISDYQFSTTVEITNKRHLELFKNWSNKGFCPIFASLVHFWPFCHQISGQIRDFVPYFGVPHLDFLL